jgi:hypothetical protein
MLDLHEGVLAEFAAGMAIVHDKEWALFLSRRAPRPAEGAVDRSSGSRRAAKLSDDEIRRRRNARDRIWRRKNIVAELARCSVKSRAARRDPVKGPRIRERERARKRASRALDVVGFNAARRAKHARDHDRVDALNARRRAKRAKRRALRLALRLAQ